MTEVLPTCQAVHGVATGQCFVTGDTNKNGEFHEEFHSRSLKSLMKNIVECICKVKVY